MIAARGYLGVAVAIILGVVIQFAHSGVTNAQSDPVNFTVKLFDALNQTKDSGLGGAEIPAKKSIMALIVPASGTSLDGARILSVSGAIVSDSKPGAAPILIEQDAVDGDPSAIELKLAPGSYSLSAKVKLSDGRDGEVAPIKFTAVRQTGKSRDKPSFNGKFSLVDASGSVIVGDLSKKNSSGFESKRAVESLRLKFKNSTGKKVKKSSGKRTAKKAGYGLNMLAPDGEISRQRVTLQGAEIQINLGTLSPGSYLIKIVALGSSGELMNFAIVIYVPEIVIVPEDPKATPTVPAGATPTVKPSPTSTAVPPTPTAIPTATKPPATATPTATATKASTATPTPGTPQPPIVSGGPVILHGTAADITQKELVATLTKPSNLQSVNVILRDVFDADNTNEGQICINNDSQCIVLFGGVGTPDKDSTTLPEVPYVTNASWWKNGTNSIIVRRTSTLGFNIGRVELQLVTSGIATPTPVPTATPQSTTPPVATPTPGSTTGIPQGLDALACQDAGGSRLPWEIQALTKFQMKTVVEQLFGASAVNDPTIRSIIANVPDDRVAKGFDTETRPLSITKLRGFQSILTPLATRATIDATLRRSLEQFAGVSCGDTLVLESGCGATFIGAFIRAVEARSVPSSVVSSAAARYSANLQKYGREKAYAGFLMGSLVGPFSYLQAQNAERNRSGQLSGFELAGRLSMTITGGFPDAELRMRAADGSLLNNANVLRQQVARLIRTPMGRRGLGHFANQWNNTSIVQAPPPSPGFVPSVDAATALREAASREVADLFAHTAIDLKGGLEEFFGTNKAVPDHDWLASIYGTARSSSPVVLGAEARRGIFTRAAFSLLGAVPDYLPMPHRGYSIYTSTMCGSVPPFPVGIDTSLPANAPSIMSSREYFVALTERAACIGCHSTMNPWGYALGNLNVFGGIISNESVPNRVTKEKVILPVDSRTTLSIDGMQVSVGGPNDLSVAVGQSVEAKACFGTRLAQAAVGKKITPHCAAKRPFLVLKNKTGGIEEAITTFVTAPEFLAR